MQRPIESTVLDTVIVIGAILGRTEGADAQMVRALTTGEFHLAVSDDALREVVRVLDLALGAGADHIVTRDPHLLELALTLGFDVRTPPEMLRIVRESGRVATSVARPFSWMKRWS